MLDRRSPSPGAAFGRRLSPQAGEVSQPSSSATRMNTRRTATIHGWLLLLPAMALLALFTHWPAVATLIDFASTRRRARGGRRASSASTITRSIVADPVFWQSFANNLWFALGTIPVSIALAHR